MLMLSCSITAQCTELVSIKILDRLYEVVLIRNVDVAVKEEEMRTKWLAWEFEREKMRNDDIKEILSIKNIVKGERLRCYGHLI